MLQLFHKNMIFQVVILLVVVLLLWGRSLLSPPAVETSQPGGILFSLLSSSVVLTPRWWVLIAMLLVLLESLLLNIVLSGANLAPQTSLLPAVLFILFASANTSTFSPQIIVLGILIFCIWMTMMHGTPFNIKPSKICGITALISLSTLIYTPSAMLLLWYILIAVNYSLYGWKEWGALILGLLAPFTLLILILYTFGDIESWWTSFIQSLSQIHPALSSSNPVQSIACGVLILFISIALVKTLIHIGEHTVLWQKNASSVVLTTIGCLAMLLYSSFFPTDLTLFAPTAAFCGFHLLLPKQSNSVQGKKKLSWIYDIVFVLIIVASVLC